METLNHAQSINLSSGNLGYKLHVIGILCYFVDGVLTDMH